MRKLLSAGISILIPMVCASAAWAQEDVRKVKPAQPELKVIEEKCLVCHNRERIEQAVREKKEKEKVLQRMEKRGAVLNDAERLVMGHFWQQEPFREKIGVTPSKEKGMF